MEKNKYLKYKNKYSNTNNNSFNLEGGMKFINALNSPNKYTEKKKSTITENIEMLIRIRDDLNTLNFDKLKNFLNEKSPNYINNLHEHIEKLHSIHVPLRIIINTLESSNYIEQQQQPTYGVIDYSNQRQTLRNTAKIGEFDSLIPHSLNKKPTLRRMQGLQSTSPSKQPEQSPSRLPRLPRLPSLPRLTSLPRLPRMPSILSPRLPRLSRLPSTPPSGQLRQSTSPSRLSKQQKQSTVSKVSKKNDEIDNGLDDSVKNWLGTEPNKKKSSGNVFDDLFG